MFYFPMPSLVGLYHWLIQDIKHKTGRINLDFCLEVSRSGYICIIFYVAVLIPLLQNLPLRTSTYPLFDKNTFILEVEIHLSHKFTFL